jgi:hypothetical protein
MSDYDTITDLAQQINALQAQIADLNSAATARAALNETLASDIQTLNQKIYLASLKFHEYIRQLTANFGDDDVAQCLNIERRHEYRVIVPVSHQVYITVEASSEDEAIEKVQNGEKEREIRTAISYVSSYDFTHETNNAEVEAITYTYPLSVPLFD